MIDEPLKQYMVEYSENNSGGNWWLDEEDWEKLEINGWHTGIKDFSHKAFKRFDSIEEALREFERLTGQDTSEEGRDCCGPPHEFSMYDDEGIAVIKDVSGRELLPYLFPGKKIPSSLREALEELDNT